MTRYPVEIDSALTIPEVVDNFSALNAVTVNRLRAAIIAMQQELGIKPSGIYATVRNRLDVIENYLGISDSGESDGYLVEPGGTNGAVQYNNGGLFEGAARVAISSDGYLELNKNASGGVATIGDIRVSNNFTIYGRSADETTNTSVLKYSKNGSKSVITIGWNADSFSTPGNVVDTSTVWSKESAGLAVGNVSGQTAAASVIVGPNSIWTGDAANFRGSINWPNMWLTNYSAYVNLGSSPYDPFGGGLGYFVMQDRLTAATGNPTNAFWLWSDSSTHHPIVQLPNGSIYDLISSNSPGGSTNSIQYNNAGVFGGASHTSISSDGYLEIGSDLIGGVSTTGNIRLNKTFTISSRDRFDTENLDAMSQYSSIVLPDGYQDNCLDLASGYDILSSTPKRAISFNTIDINDTEYDSGLFIFRDNVLANGNTSKGLYAYPNFALGTDSDLIDLLSTDTFGSGKGLILLKDIDTVPTSNPSSGFFLWSDATNHHPTVQLPNGSIYDLIDGYATSVSGTGLWKSISGSLQSAASLLVNADVDAAAAIAYSKLNLSNSIINADVNASAAIAGTKISPDFGSQLIKTTGNIRADGYIGAGAGAYPTSGSFRAPVAGVAGESLLSWTTSGGTTLRAIWMAATNVLAFGEAGASVYVNSSTSTNFGVDGFIPLSLASNQISIQPSNTAVVNFNLTNGLAMTGGYPITWSAASSTPTMKQLDLSTNSATGQVLTVQAQNATGTSATGGALNLTSGTGTSVHGSVNIKVGGTTVLQVSPSNNISLLSGSPSYGSGSGVIYLKDATTAPSTNPTGGNLLYSDSADGYLKYRQTTGNVVILDGAGPAFTPGGDLIGDETSQTVANLQGIELDASTPIDGYALVYDALSTSIKFQAVAGGGGGGGGITEGQHAALRQLVHFIDGPAEGFVSGAYREILPTADPFPTSVIWYNSILKTSKIIEKSIVYDSNQNPITISWSIYDIDGVTILVTASDSIFYDGPFEISRIRTVS